VRVLAGEALGVRSPLRPNHPVRMLEVLLDAAGAVTLALPGDELTLVLGVAGEGEVGASGRAVAVHPGALLRYSAGTASSPAVDGERAGHAGAGDHAAGHDVVTLRAGLAPLTVAVLSGRPLHEPIVVHGPFAMSTHARLAAVIDAHRRGELGHLDPSF
jgi:redox-sensitive bicupin YhaK (pirin superfamily)